MRTGGRSLPAKAARWIGVVLLAAACAHATPADPVARYLYVVGCDGRVDKLDTIERKNVETFRLSERSGTPPAVPDAPDGRIDNCLAQQVVVDTTAGQVILVAPTEARLDGAGLQTFRALTFSLPDWRLVATRPAGRSAEPPRLRVDAGGRARVVDVAESDPATLDVGGYAGRPGDAMGIVIASSGRTRLLSLLSARAGPPDLALADTAARTVMHLVDLPTTDFRHARLAPGGSHVLVEAIDAATPGARPTGLLRLYDAQGRVVADRTDERIRDSAFVALTPNGDAVYRGRTDYFFVPFGVRFGDAAVTRPIPVPLEPGLVSWPR